MVTTEDYQQIVTYFVTETYDDPTQLLDHSTSTLAPTKSPPGIFHYNVVRQMKFYMLGIIIPVGIITNILALSVFFNSAMRRTTTGHYLISLAFADATILVGELLLWVNTDRIKNENTLGIDFAKTYNVWCKLIMYIRYAGRIWSSWVTVIITVERYIIVAFPLKVSLISTTIKAKVVIVVEMILSFAVTVYPFFTVGVYQWSGKYDCYTLPPYDRYRNWNLAVMGCGELLVPSVIVCIFTALILYKVAQAARARTRLSGSHTTRETSQQSQLTVVLLAVAIAFVVIRLPYTLLFYINDQKKNIWPNIDAWTSFWIYAFNSFSQCLAVLNYAINFFLYCLCGTSFRNELIRIYRCRTHLSTNALTSTVTVSYSPYKAKSIGNNGQDELSMVKNGNHRTDHANQSRQSRNSIPLSQSNGLPMHRGNSKLADTTNRSHGIDHSDSHGFKSETTFTTKL